MFQENELKENYTEDKVQPVFPYHRRLLYCPRNGGNPFSVDVRFYGITVLGGRCSPKIDAEFVPRADRPTRHSRFDSIVTDTRAVSSFQFPYLFMLENRNVLVRLLGSNFRRNPIDKRRRRSTGLQPFDRFYRNYYLKLKLLRSYAIQRIPLFLQRYLCSQWNYMLCVLYHVF